MKNRESLEMNQILVEIGEKKLLCTLLNVSHPTVRRALNGEIDTPIALRIRKAAIERGGVEKKVPNSRNNYQKSIY